MSIFKVRHDPTPATAARSPTAAFSVQMHPDFALRAWEAEACAPLVLDGSRLVAAKWCLLARTIARGHALTDDPGRPPLLGAPTMLGETAWLMATGRALGIEWYATKLALGVGGWQAAGLALLAETFGLALLAVIQVLRGWGSQAPRGVVLDTTTVVRYTTG